MASHCPRSGGCRLRKHRIHRLYMGRRRIHMECHRRRSGKCMIPNRRRDRRYTEIRRMCKTYPRFRNCPGRLQDRRTCLDCRNRRRSSFHRSCRRACCWAGKRPSRRRCPHHRTRHWECHPRKPCPPAHSWAGKCPHRRRCLGGRNRPHWQSRKAFQWVSPDACRRRSRKCRRYIGCRRRSRTFRPGCRSQRTFAGRRSKTCSPEGDRNQTELDTPFRPCRKSTRARRSRDRTVRCIRRRRTRPKSAD